MVNPFFTIGYGGPEYFCDREEETATLATALVNGRNVAVISPRRLGKTGLILHTFNRLMAEDSTRRCFYLDIYSTENQTDLVKQMASAILGSMDTFGEKLMASLSAFFKSCRPVFSIESPRRPFYQSTQRMGLMPLDRDVYYEFASRLMKNGGKELPAEVFADAYDFARGYTYYIQDIMNRLYSMPHTVITKGHLLEIYHDIKKEGEVVYKDYCELMARGQIKLLRAIAREDIVQKPHEQAFMRRHNLTAVSSVKLALSTLVKNGVVAKSEKGYYIYDRYLSLWLTGEQGLY